MMAEPSVTPVTRPVAETDATASLLELHVNSRFACGPPDDPMNRASSCCVSPTGTVASLGVTTTFGPPPLGARKGASGCSGVPQLVRSAPPRQSAIRVNDDGFRMTPPCVDDAVQLCFMQIRWGETRRASESARNVI